MIATGTGEGGQARWGTESARQSERLHEMERAHRRLQALYEVSKLLTRFRGIERTLPRIISVFARTLSLRNVVFILQPPALSPWLSPPTSESSHSRLRTLVWQAWGENPETLRAALAHAEAAYGYLVGAAIVFDAGTADQVVELPRRRRTFRRADPGPSAKPILLPLVVAHGTIFGALQIESAGTWEELDVVFVNAVVNQLAIAIERDAALRSNVARIEQGEREQRLLAVISDILGSCFEYRRALSGLAEFVVSFLADICIVDQVKDDGTIERIEVLFADQQKQRTLADQVRRFSPRPGWRTPEAQVAASGKSVLISVVTDPETEGIAQNTEHAGVMRAAGLSSMMAVPLCARGKTIGVLTLCSGASQRHFTAADLALVEEIAHRGAVAIDNARLYERAKQATIARDNLVAVVSHDLRNALSVITLALAAQVSVPSGQERRKADKQLMLIRRTSEGMNRLIEDLLQTASLEAGQLSVNLRAVEAEAVVRRALETLHGLAAAKSLDLRAELAPGLPAVCADGARIGQVLANLVGNAIKFTPREETITIRAEHEGDRVRFTVADSGLGIAKEDLPHLFDRFWQAKRTNALGTGLGLFIAKGIVEAHGGRLWVESEVGRGTSFFFTLSVAVRSPTDAPGDAVGGWPGEAGQA